MVRRWSSGAPAKLLNNLILSDIGLVLRLRRSQLGQLQLATAEAGDLIRRPQTLEAIDGRLQNVVRISGALALGEDVSDSGGLQHRPNRTAGDHSGAFHRRLEQYPSGAEVPEHVVRNGVAEQRDLEQILLRVLAALANRLGDLVRLAQAHAHVTVAIAHHHQRREGEATASLHHFRHAVDVHHAVGKVEVVWIDWYRQGKSFL